MSEEIPLAIFLAVDQLLVAGPFESPKEALKHLYNKCLVDKQNELCEFRYQGQKMLIHLDDIQVIADEIFPLLDNPKDFLEFD
jgi:hypothetical protein